MVADVDEGYAQFCEYHEMQLKSIGLPEHAWRQVYEKVFPRTVDDLSSVMRVEGGSAVSTQTLKKYSSMFVVPHHFSGDGGMGMYSALNDNLEQPAKFIDLLGDLDQSVSETEDEQIRAIMSLTKCTWEVATNTYTSCDNDLIYTIESTSDNPDSNTVDVDKIKQSLAGNMPKKPEILSYAEFKSAITDEKSEHHLTLMYNDYVHKKQLEIGDDGHGSTDKYRWEDDADEHVITVTIPIPAGTTRKDVISKVTSKHWTFGIRGQTPIIYGNFEGLVEPDECTWYFDKGTGNITATIQKADIEVMLWKNLIIGEDRVNENWVVSERKRKIVHAMDTFWYKGLTYQAITPEGKQAHNWYLPSNSLSAMSHSDNPNFRFAPFWSCYGGKIYTLVWPVGTVNVGDNCTINRYPVLFNGESELQRAARQFVCNINNLAKPVPDKFVAQYETLLPPHCFSPNSWLPPSESHDGQSISDITDKLYVQTTMKLSESEVSELKELNIVITKPTDHFHLTWVEGRADRKNSKKFNCFDEVLTNLIRLNEYIRTNFGKTEWWPAGYHINTELGAVVAATSHWDSVWLIRDTENAAPTFVTSHLARIARMCENGLNYFAQPYIDSISIDQCQCSLEYTVVIKNKTCWLSNVPAVHKARVEVNPDENYYLPDSFVPRSDTSCVPSIPWSKFFVEFSSKSNDPWPVQDNKIQHVIHDLLASFVSKCTEPHCYGVQLIITPNFEVKVVGLNATPTYFPSIPHIAAAWRLLAQDSLEIQGFRKL